MTLPKFGFAISQKHFLETSYEVAYWISKQTKAHNIGDALVKSCALQIVAQVCGLEQRKHWKRLPCQIM
jgi:hypothetical protein